MVPKLHAKGCSFRGAAAYLLHDVGADTSYRVAWTETKNLATANAQIAWRVMAATAMDQSRLKAQAGIKNTGRKSIDSVLHLTLSWHPEESDELTREEMMRAANGAIRALGAEDHQAMIVCHDDQPQPHIHLLLNRVSPLDGRMLSSSKEKLNLSRWAETYEKERGEVLCAQRVINNAARDRGEYTRGTKDRPRHIYELEAANMNHPGLDQIRQVQRKKDTEIARRSRTLRERQAEAWKHLERNHRQEIAALRAQAVLDIENAKKRVREDHRPQWEALYHQHQSDRREFDQREKKLLGRVQNALKAVDFRAIVTGKDRRKAISDAFQVLSSSGARLVDLKRRQEVESRRLTALQRKAEKQATDELKVQRDTKIAARRKRYLEERHTLKLTQQLENAAERTHWKTRGQQRRAAYKNRRNHDEKTHQPDGLPGQTPQTELDEKSAPMNPYERRMRQRQAKRGQERDRDRGDDRSL